MPKPSDIRIITRIMVHPELPDAYVKYGELGPFDDEKAVMTAAVEEDYRGAGVVVYQRWAYPLNPRWIDVREVYSENA